MRISDWSSDVCSSDLGRATPFLDAIAERLGALDAGHRASGDFFAALRDHDLLEPFTLEVPLEDGSKHSLVGYHIIDEAKLQALDAAAIGRQIGRASCRARVCQYV